MTVMDAMHGVKVDPDHVFVVQPNTSVAIADGVLSVTPRPDDRRPHYYPVDPIQGRMDRQASLCKLIA